MLQSYQLIITFILVEFSFITHIIYMF